MSIKTELIYKKYDNYLLSYLKITMTDVFLDTKLVY